MAHGCSAKYALVALLTHANNIRLQSCGYCNRLLFECATEYEISIHRALIFAFGLWVCVWLCECLNVFLAIFFLFVRFCWNCLSNISQKEAGTTQIHTKTTKNYSNDTPMRRHFESENMLNICFVCIVFVSLPLVEVFRIPSVVGRHIWPVCFLRLLVFFLLLFVFVLFAYFVSLSLASCAARIYTLSAVFVQFVLKLWFLTSRDSIETLCSSVVCGARFCKVFLFSFFFSLVLYCFVIPFVSTSNSNKNFAHRCQFGYVFFFLSVLLLTNWFNDLFAVIGVILNIWSTKRQVLEDSTKRR